MKVAELTGIALDWAVAKCEGWSNYDHGYPCEKAGFFCLNGDYSFALYLSSYSPSTDWALGGPIIERELVTVGPNPFGPGFAANKKDIDMYGPTPLIAAMRCYVASKLGDNIEIPEELQGNKEAMK